MHDHGAPYFVGEFWRRPAVPTNSLHAAFFKKLADVLISPIDLSRIERGPNAL